MSNRDPWLKSSSNWSRHFVEPPLSSGVSLAGSGGFFWKSNWTKFDHVGSTGGHWETISGSFSISFGSELGAQSRCAPIIVFSPWYNWWVYRIEKLSNADISDFSAYRKKYRIEPPTSYLNIDLFCVFPPKILRKFQKFSENSPKFLKIRRKFLKKKVFSEALISYRYEALTANSK